MRKMKVGSAKLPSNRNRTLLAGSGRICSMSSKMSRMTLGLIVVSLCLCCTTLILAQSTGGRILGRVADSSGAVLAGVKVTATNEATGVSRDTLTNTSGDYAFPEVPVGTY